MISSGRETVITSEMPFSGKLLKIRVDTVLLPSRRRSKREIVEHRGAVAIVAIVDNKVVLERQYRHAAGKVMWEIPAGTLEADECPETAAYRELEEETGFVAGKLEELAHFYVAVGYSTEIIWLYFATGLKKKHAIREEDEFIETITLPLEEAMKMVSSNRIEDAKTIIGLLMAMNKVGVR